MAEPASKFLQGRLVDGQDVARQLKDDTGAIMLGIRVRACRACRPRRACLHTLRMFMLHAL